MRSDSENPEETKYQPTKLFTKIHYDVSLNTTCILKGFQGMFEKTFKAPILLRQGCQTIPRGFINLRSQLLGGMVTWRFGRPKLTKCQGNVHRFCFHRSTPTCKTRLTCWKRGCLVNFMGVAHPAWGMPWVLLGVSWENTQGRMQDGPRDAQRQNLIIMSLCDLTQKGRMYEGILPNVALFLEFKMIIHPEIVHMHSIYMCMVLVSDSLSIISDCMKCEPHTPKKDIQISSNKLLGKL